VFWFGFAVSWAKLVALRIAVFGLLSLDTFTELRHAPRYGAGGFNVPQIPLPEVLQPGRVGYGVGMIALSYLLAFAAFGIATRAMVATSAALYAWCYFGSQLDSYQHHYLIAVLLVVLSFVPWHPPAKVTARTPIRSWALRLVLVLLAIVYLWAAISKLDPAWLDGTTLARQFSRGLVHDLVAATVGFTPVAWAVVTTELSLAATIWWRRGWIVAAPLGISLHVVIAASPLDIGFFAYLMLALYLLLVPDGVLAWIYDHARGAAGTSIVPGVVFAAGALGIGLGLALVIRFPHVTVMIPVLTLLPLALALAWRRRLALLGAAHIVVLASWLLVDRATSFAEDYYRFWGGSQRRIGDRDTAARALRELLAIAPDDASGHFQLGRIQLAQSDPEGLEHLRAAQRLAPRQARAFVEEARWLANQGQPDAALAIARRAVAAEPGDLPRPRSWSPRSNNTARWPRRRRSTPHDHRAHQERRADHGDPRRPLPEGRLVPRSRERVPAARRDHPLRPVHRRARQHRDPRAVRARPGCRRDGQALARGRRPADHPHLRPRREQGAEHRRDERGARRTPRRRGPERRRRARGAARRRAQDRVRGGVAGLRHRGVPRRHPHPPARRTLAAVARAERRGGRARPDGGVPARALVHPAPPADRVRSRVLHGEAARAGSVPGLQLGDVRAPGDRRAARRPQQAQHRAEATPHRALTARRTRSVHDRAELSLRQIGERDAYRCKEELSDV
jgi:tetratricopeptide (TPR) repeat protein